MTRDVAPTDKPERTSWAIGEIPMERKVLFALLCAGALLRVWHINWSLPDLYEEATPLVRGWKMWNWGNTGFEFNPHFFNYPALTFYLNFLLQALQFAVSFLLGFTKDLNSFGADLSSIVIPARLLVVAFDVGTIWLTYLLAKELLNETTEYTALIAAAFVAFNPLHIEQAHYITVDTPLTFFVMLSLLFINRLYRSPSRPWYLYAGLSVGLAASTKYTGVILLPVLVVIHMLRAKSLQKAIRSLQQFDLWFAAGIAAGIFFMTNPFILLSYDEFKRDFSFEQFHVAYGHLGLDPNQSTISYYFFDVLASIFGWPLIILLIVTVGVMLVRREKSSLALLLFPLFYFLLIASWEMRAARYSLPMIPMLLLIAATGIELSRDRISKVLMAKATTWKITPQRLNVGTLCVMTGVALFQPLSSVISFERSISMKDTRTIAREWIQARARHGAAIATGPFGIAIPDTAYRILYIPFLAEQSENVAAFYDARWYEDCDLLIASDFDKARFQLEPAKYPEQLSYYDSLQRNWKLVAEFIPQPYQPGPMFRFYVPPFTNIPSLFDSSLFRKLESVPESVKTSNFLRNLSIILIQKRKFERAEQVLRNLVSVESGNLEARFTLARLLLTLGKNELALVQAQKIVYQDPSRPEVFVFAGDVLMNLGRGQEAETSFWTALKLNGGYEAAYEDLIDYYTRSKQNSKLLTTLKTYYAILPKESPEAKSVSERIRELEKHP